MFNALAPIVIFPIGLAAAGWIFNAISLLAAIGLPAPGTGPGIGLRFAGLVVAPLGAVLGWL